MGKIGQEFMEKTTYQYAEKSQQQQGLPQPDLEHITAAGQCFDLPQVEKVENDEDLLELITKRRSVRRYQATLSLEELSYLLWCCQGVKEVKADKFTLRTVPSAGARHALETYLAIQGVQGLPRGLYQYVATSHQLRLVRPAEDISVTVASACLSQGFIAKSPVTMLWVADVKRMYWRYGERGYRYLHLDAGHVCQNLYLAAESIGAGVCAVAAFDDYQLNELLGFDGKEHFAIYLATLGKKEE